MEPPTDLPPFRPSDSTRDRHNGGRSGFLRQTLQELSTSATSQPRSGGTAAVAEAPASDRLPPKLLVRLAQERLAQRRRRLVMLRVGVILLALVISAVLATGVVFWQQSAQATTTEGALLPRGFDTFGSPMLPPDQVLLVMGVDVNPQGKTPAEAFEGVRTDTMMLMRVDTSHGDPKLSIVSLPRDTKITLENGRTDKLNSAFAYGGAEAAKRVVEKSFGIPIDHYVVINLNGVKDVVEAVGGLDVYVPQKMKYHDFSGHLHIDFEPGWRHMNGTEAEGFLRFRHDALGDIGRIKRQQQFLSAVTRKMKDPWVLPRIPSLVNVAMSNIQTDMPLDAMVRMGWLGRSLPKSAIRLATLPGEPSSEWASFWVVHAESAQLLLNRMILGDNAAHETVDSLNVGLIYPKEIAERLPALKEALAAKNLNVTCETPRRRETTQIVEHTARVSDAWVGTLRGIDPKLKEAHWVVAPHGASYEPLSCGGREDMTLVIGNDIAL